MPVWNYLWKVFCILCHDIWSWYSQILTQFSTDLFLNKATIYEILKFPLCLSWGYVTWEVMKSFIICLKYVHFFSNEHFLSTYLLDLVSGTGNVSEPNRKFSYFLDVSFKEGRGILTVNKNICIKEWWQEMY